MRVFVYEHLTAGGLLSSEDDFACLAPEGDMMIRALLADLAEIPEVECVALRDPRLGLDLPAQVLASSPLPSDLWPGLERALELSEAVWPIAPESDGCLERIAQLVLDNGRVLLNSRPPAVRITASKLATSRALAAGGTRVVPTYASPEEVPKNASVLVVKPDDGAGCVETYVTRDRALIVRSPEMARRNRIYQPLIAGDPRSLCVLCADGIARLLSCNRQHIMEKDGKLEFAGVTVNALHDAGGRYARLAQSVIDAIPGLWGHVGIDFVETHDGPVVIEINPRVTTACAGLRGALGMNLGRLVMGLPDSLQGLAQVPPRLGQPVRVRTPGAGPSSPATHDAL